MRQNLQIWANYQFLQSGGSQKSVSYNWSVSSGTIISGQGTPKIKLKVTPMLANTPVTAMVEIQGTCVDCTRTASANVYIDKPK